MPKMKINLQLHIILDELVSTKKKVVSKEVIESERANSIGPSLICVCIRI